MKNCMNKPYFFGELMDEVFGYYLSTDTRIKNDKDNYDLVFKVPGLSKDDVKITVEDDVLNISGENDDDHSVEIHKRYGLPSDVKVDGISADVKNGILKVRVPRKKPKSVDVEIN